MQMLQWHEFVAKNIKEIDVFMLSSQPPAVHTCRFFKDIDRTAAETILVEKSQDKLS